MGQELHRPDDGSAIDVAAVVLHPHPGMGGDRHHPLVVAVADGLAARGIAALRPDLTDPNPEVSAVALEELSIELLADLGAQRLVLVGYSWGSIVTVRAQPDALAARVLIAPPVSGFELGGTDGTPTLVLVPAYDQFGPPDAVSAALDGWVDTAMEVIEGTDHFLAGAVTRIAGAVTRIAERVVEWVVATTA
jgi:uncharacterized protein